LAINHDLGGFPTPCNQSSTPQFAGSNPKGSKLNRRALKECGTLLLAFLPVMIGVMIEFGVAEDWGRVCFPPEGPIVRAS
jgi:hypothetical protein